MDFAKLFEYGSLVKVDYYGLMASRSLTAMDLGFDTDDFTFCTGRRGFLSSNTYRSILSMDAKQYRCVSEFTFPFFLFNARFLPHKMLIPFSNKMDRLIRMFHSRKDYFLENYEASILQSRSMILKEAQRAFTRHRKLVKDPMDKDAFINGFIEKVSGLYPKLEDMKQKMHFNYYLFQIGPPSLNRIELPADQQHVYERIKVLRTEFNNQMELSAHKFVENLVTRIRDTFSDRIMAIHDNLKRGGLYRACIDKSLKSIIARFYSMNIANDVKMAERILSFETRFINRFTVEDIRRNKFLKNNFLADIYILASMAKKQEEINEVSVLFKKLIGVI